MKPLIFDTSLEISRINLLDNLNYFRKRLAPKTKIMAMVKALFYGLGTYDVAKLLEDNGVHYLGVANTFEGVELRKAGIEMPIMVMKPSLESFDLVRDNQLTPTLFSIYSLQKLIDTLDNAKPISISLKIDTGMHRLGFDELEIPDLIRILKQHPFLKIESIFSHLAASDDLMHQSFTHFQIKKFEKIANAISTHFNYPIDLHLLNTNGIINYNESQFNMVRLGIGLYGFCSDPSVQKQLKSVSTLKSKIAQIKDINKGETIGYGRVGVAKTGLRIATIPVGYADGFSRKLSNGNWEMIVNDQKAPVIGSVCMDMVMIDVTGIDCSVGDETFIFSPQNTISEMAKKIGTIPYDILTSYSPRVKRVFLI
jgi:alanine racemase